MLNITTKKVISLQDWDGLVEDVYGRPYSFQQQDGCKERGNFNLSIPDDAYDFENDSIPEVVNGNEMGVSFAAWLARDPKQLLENGGAERADKFGIELFWTRSFYPNVQMIANDLHAGGIIPEGEYTIEIDW